MIQPILFIHWLRSILKNITGCYRSPPSFHHSTISLFPSSSYVCVIKFLHLFFKFQFNGNASHSISYHSVSFQFLCLIAVWCAFGFASGSSPYRLPIVERIMCAIVLWLECCMVSVTVVTVNQHRLTLGQQSAAAAAQQQQELISQFAISLPFFCCQLTFIIRTFSHSRINCKFCGAAH